MVELVVDGKLDGEVEYVIYVYLCMATSFPFSTRAARARRAGCLSVCLSAGGRERGAESSAMRKGEGKTNQCHNHVRAFLPLSPKLVVKHNFILKNSNKGRT